MYDILITNARIADGTGGPMYHADVAVKDGKIAKIGHPLKVGTQKVIDGRGKVLAPGFIDAHSHLDQRVEEMHHCRHMLLQGVTTVIGGMCGDSALPFGAEHVADNLRLLGGSYSEQSLQARGSLADFRRHLETVELGTNMTFLIGHSTLRAAVMGYADRKATPEELARMQQLLAQCMEEGAMGASFGLFYPPGSYADQQEITAIAQTVADHGGIVTAHVRSESNGLVEAAQELLQAVRATGVRYVHSHLKAGGEQNRTKTATTLALLHQAAEDGFDVYCDQYPYTAASNALRNLIPAALHAQGNEGLMEMVTDPRRREELRPQVLGALTPWERMKTVMVGNSASHPDCNGRMLNAIAEELGTDPFTVFCDLLRDDKLSTMAIYFSVREEDVELVMGWDRAMFGSDGGFGQKPTDHPRTFGTFPRVLRHYVREKGILTLENAIRKMTHLPATVYNLSAKGLIREGMDADLVLFDPETVADLGDYAQPARGNTGFACVVVNGRIAVENDQITGVLAGNLLFRR